MEPEEDDVVAKQAKEMEAKYKNGPPKKKPMLLKNKQEVYFLKNQN